MLHLNQQQSKHSLQQQRHDHIKEQLNGLVARVQTTEELIKESRDRQEQFVLKMQDRSTLMGNVSYQSQLVPPDAHRQERARQEVQAIESFIRQLGVKVNKLRCQMLMDHVEIFAQLSDIQRDILFIHLPRWHLDQQLANNGAQTEAHSLDCIQSWVEMLTDITWRLRNQLVSMHTLITSTAGMLPFDREQEMNSLGLRINKSLETLILNTFVVEKQPPQVMKTNTRFTSTVRYLCNPGFNVHHNNKPIVKVSILSEHNARAIKQRHQEILRNPWSYLQDPPAASFMHQLEPQQQHSPPDQPVAMPVDQQQQTVIYRSTTAASSVQQQQQQQQQQEESLFIMDPPPHYMETVSSPPQTVAAPAPATVATTTTTTTTSTSAPEQQQISSPAHQQPQIPPTSAQQQQHQQFFQPHQQRYHQILQPQKVGPKPQHFHHHLQHQQQQQPQQQVQYLGYNQSNNHNHHHQHQQAAACQQQVISNKLNIDDFDPSGEILNNTNQIEYQESTGQLVCHFRNMQLKKIKRTEKKGTESVMDEKFILVFHVHFRIDEPYQATSPWFHLQGDMSFHVLALSLPVVVIVHGNQDPHAWATVTWHNAFARQDELLYQVPDKVSWRELGQVLSNKFRSYAGKGLNEQNLAYLAAKISRAKLEADDGIVSWNQFAKEPLPDMSFTFWEWFHSILKLTKDHLRDLWNADRIYGFVGKKGCVDLLLGSSYHEPVATGTFLLRYSETELGGVSICWAGPSRPTNNSNSFIQVWQRNSPTNACSNVIMHLQPFLSKDLQTRSLADRIRDLQDLLYLYPNLAKDEAFGSHYTPIITVDPLANGYIRPMLIQTLVANYPKTHSGTGSISDGAAVGAPATPNSYSQSSPDGIYADNNCVMNDFESNYSAFDPVS